MFFGRKDAVRLTVARGARRETELRWRESHADMLRQYAGEWIALEGERIVAHGRDVAQAVGAARAAGVRIPYVFRVEEAPEDVVPIGL